MIPQIASAISKGYTAKQVISFLLRKFPNHKSAIEKALASGFTADQVLKYLSRKSGQDLQEPDQVNTDYSKMRGIDQARRQQSERTALGAIGAVATAPLALNALSNISGPGQAMAMQQAMPDNPATLIGQAPQKLLPTLPQTLPQAPINPQMPTQPRDGPANIPRQPNIAQAIPAQRDPQKNIDLIKSVKEDKRIANLLSGGMSTKDIAALIKKVAPREVSKALEATEGGIEGAIQDYASSLLDQPDANMNQNEADTTLDQLNAKTAISQPQQQQEIQSPGTKLDAIQPEIEREDKIPKGFEKGDTVITPKGIAEVKAFRNGKAIVEVDGKKFEMREGELEPTEFSEDEIADAYDDLMAKIPEEHKSGFIQWAGYDEDTKTLGYIPRGENYQKLEDISPEEAELIKNGKGVARTSGKNTEGMWIIGGDTRGIISQITHDRRRKKEAEEKKQLTLFDLPNQEKGEKKGMKPIFDELAYARNLSHERARKKKLEERAKLKKQKEEEKERIKREKDEAKKRKR